MVYPKLGGSLTSETSPERRIHGTNLLSSLPSSPLQLRALSVGAELVIDKLEPYCCPRPDPAMRIDLELDSAGKFTCVYPGKLLLPSL